MHKILLIIFLLLPLSAQANTQNVDSLIGEANILFSQGKTIDARSKLLKAIELDPKAYTPQMMLAEYYLIEVGHFRLAYRYSKRSLDLFYEQHGTKDIMKLPQKTWQTHATLLFLLAEVKLNLDDYKGALETLEEFQKKYWRNSLPGSKAWILMKLKRIDDAIRTAQAGIIRGAEPGRTYNILGILLSVKGNRELSLRAFAKAIEAEKALGTFGQPATPLNNAGEVYRELFQEDLAEAAWRQALASHDGCEHVLPSLNLAIMYIDELRLFSAERALQDFNACFAQKAERSDTEHRSIMALAMGRVELRKGNPDKAIELIAQALDREQWFGKIGTNANDLEFAASLAMAQALRAQAAVLNDRITTSVFESAENYFKAKSNLIRAWWLEKQARNLGVDELEDFEDLWIRNTDTMVEYPSFGQGLAGLPSVTLESMINKLKKEDRRPVALAYYSLFLAQNYLEHGDASQAITQLKTRASSFREIDRLVKAEFLATLIKANQESTWFWERDAKFNNQQHQLVEDLFEILPSHVRYNGFKLAVKFVSTDDDVLDMLTESNFEQVSKSNYSLEISRNKNNLRLALKENSRIIARIEESFEDEDKLIELCNGFIQKVFEHKSDPAAAAIPQLELPG